LKFHLVTACLTVDEALQSTIASIEAQSILHSTDHSVSYRIQCKDTQAAVPQLPSSSQLAVEFVQSPDQGLYHALEIGFAAAEDSDVYGYLGAGDLLSPHALEIVAEVFEQGAQWLTGLICGYNDRGHMIESQVPFRYRRDLIKQGFYGRLLPFIQQESTFWSGALHGQLDWAAIAAQRLAGDALIWKQLAEHAELQIVEAWLGGFQMTPDQLSSDKPAYLREMAAFSEAATPGARLLACWDWLIWRCPRLTKRYFAPPRFIYDQSSRRYRLVA